jgi:hypothetical protein
MLMAQMETCKQPVVASGISDQLSAIGMALELLAAERL